MHRYAQRVISDNKVIAVVALPSVGETFLRSEKLFKDLVIAGFLFPLKLARAGPPPVSASCAAQKGCIKTETLVVQAVVQCAFSLAALNNSTCLVHTNFVSAALQRVAFRTKDSPTATAAMACEDAT